MTIRQTLIHVLERQLARLHRDPVRLNAMRSAYTIIAKRYPIGVESGFDQHFLRHGAAPLLEPFYQGGEVPNAQELAEAWCAQFFLTAERYPDVMATIQPIMNDFVYVLNSELQYLERSMPQRALSPQLSGTVAD